MTPQELQIYRTIDKFPKLGPQGTWELLQKPIEKHGAGLDPLRAGMWIDYLTGDIETFQRRKAVMDDILKEING